MNAMPPRLDEQRLTSRPENDLAAELFMALAKKMPRGYELPESARHVLENFRDSVQSLLENNPLREVSIYDVPKKLTIPKVVRILKNYRNEIQDMFLEAGKPMPEVEDEWEETQSNLWKELGPEMVRMIEIPLRMRNWTKGFHDVLLDNRDVVGPENLEQAKVQLSVRAVLDWLCYCAGGNAVTVFLFETFFTKEELLDFLKYEEGPLYVGVLLFTNLVLMPHQMYRAIQGDVKAEIERLQAVAPVARELMICNREIIDVLFGVQQGKRSLTFQELLILRDAYEDMTELGLQSDQENDTASIHSKIELVSSKQLAR